MNDATTYEPLQRCFRTVTDGADREIDAIGIVIELFKDLQGHEIARILVYLEQRYTLPPTRKEKR